ncbi:conserved hypothetical protein [Stutzerimonas stutzeri A1501]|uniref:Uncharacterized protein n=1 Tax=Stutzerimonas stutzeri (strain A1501) TaxID=379731 RepID=A4VQN4_STUS1|nr:conserved hypothetical protein [Stutzerimonas stutzeri A1501]
MLTDFFAILPIHIGRSRQSSLLPETRMMRVSFEEWCPGEDSNFHGVATART